MCGGIGMRKKTCPSCKRTWYSAAEIKRCDECGADLRKVKTQAAEAESKAKGVTNHA